MRRRTRPLAPFGAVLVVLAQAALAQAPELPLQWFPSRAPSVAGQAIPVCIDAREPGHEVDRAIALAVADALLLRVALVDVDRSIVVEAEFDDLYVDLVDRCTVYAGFKLYPATYPNWLTFTRPFYEARFVVLARPDGVARLNDLPAGAPIGVAQGTLGDLRFLTHNLARPVSERWRRIPLGTPLANLEALVEGRVDAVVVWEPWWWSLGRDDPAFAELRVVEAPVVSEPWIGVGGALTADRTFARSQFDLALAALTEDGTIAALIEAAGFPGRLGDAR
jgi:polar amino acid transport system substrate-binding protein